MHSFVAKEVLADVSWFLAVPVSLQIRASAFPAGTPASTPAGDSKLLRALSKVADKLSLGVAATSWISRHRATRDSGFASANPGFSLLQWLAQSFLLRGRFNIIFIG
jgi:hypothetical protein